MAKSIDINSEIELKNWLDGQPSQWAPIITVRAALRVLPMVFKVEHPELWLAVFRATQAANSSKSGHHAARAVLGASAMPGLILETERARRSAATDAADAVALAAAGDVTAKAVAHAAAAAEDDLWPSVSADAQWLAEPGRAIQGLALARKPLWLNDVRGDPTYKVNMPPWARELWDQWKNSASAREGGFAPWISWYESRLLGTSAGGFHHKLRSGNAAKTLDLTIATEPLTFWEREPKEVNAEIADMIQAAIADMERTPELPMQRPAAFRFTVKDGQIGVLAESGPANPEFAADTREEVLRKAGQTLERLQRTQAPSRVRDTVERLIESLGDSVADIQAGILRSKVRSLEADIAAFSSQEGELQVLPDAMAYLHDLSLSLEDLQACFPYIREIEAEGVGLGLTSGDAAAAQNHADEIAEAAQESQATSPEAKHALKELTPDIAAAPNEVVRTRLIADNLLIARNFVSVVFRHVYDHAKVGVGHIGEAAGKGIKSAVTKGTEATVLGTMAYLAFQLTGPVGALAFLLKSFGPINEIAKRLQEEDELPKGEGDEDDATE